MISALFVGKINDDKSFGGSVVSENVDGDLRILSFELWNLIWWHWEWQIAEIQTVFVHQVIRKTVRVVVGRVQRR